MNVRPASSADLPGLAAIERLTPTAPGWSLASFERELSGGHVDLFVLEDAGRLLGYASLWRAGPEAQVATIVVRPEERGRGLGARLLGHMLARARAWGAEVLRLEVSAANAAAIALYQGAGLAIVGRRAKFYNDGSDALLMELKLS